MAVLIETPTYVRKIQCPRHYLIDPREDIFLREPVPLLKDVSNSVCAEYKINKTRIQRDRWGNKLVDWKKMYELKAKGKVMQPMITASFAIENIYDPMNPVCHVCKFKCKRGKGKINDLTIKRLSG